MPEAVREAVQTQTNRLQDSIQRENDEFLSTIDDNIKKIIKEQALVEAYDADKTILESYGESVILRGDMRMMIRKDPLLDQTGGLKDKEKEGSIHQLALHLNQLPGVQADLLQGLNLDSCLPVSLLLQRNLCRLPVRWRNPHIRCLKQEPISYDKHALWGVSHWGRKRHQFYGFAVNRESALDVYSKRRIIVVTELKIVE
nr:hypothetical protein [Tanacetum cinerariifolium]